MISFAMAVGFAERRWKVALFKRELQPDGRVADVEIGTFEDVKPQYPASEIVDSRGRLAFVDSHGKLIISGGVAFVAKEL